MVNYFVCFITGSIVNGGSPLNSDILTTSWFPFAAGLSATFIIFFNVNAYTTQKVGMIVTGIFQKLSLIIPVILGILIFGESISLSKYIAIGLTFVAIFMINSTRGQSEEILAQAKRYWYWPLLVFFGSGLIEGVLFYAQETGRVQDAGIAFVSILFFMAGCWGLLYMILKNQLRRIKWIDVMAGVLIGVPNFFTIYLIIKGLDMGWEGSVLFPVNNVGVIATTAVIGMLLFKEKLTSYNLVGLVIAMVAVVLISM